MVKRLFRRRFVVVSTPVRKKNAKKIKKFFFRENKNCKKLDLASIRPGFGLDSAWIRPGFSLEGVRGGGGGRGGGRGKGGGVAGGDGGASDGR